MRSRRKRRKHKIERDKAKRKMTFKERYEAERKRRLKRWEAEQERIKRRLREEESMAINKNNLVDYVGMFVALCVVLILLKALGYME